MSELGNWNLCYIRGIPHYFGNLITWITRGILLGRGNVLHTRITHSRRGCLRSLPCSRLNPHKVHPTSTLCDVNEKQIQKEKGVLESSKTRGE